MANHRVWAARAAAALALMAAVPAAADDTRPMLHVRVNAGATLSQRIVDEALQIAGAIYRRSGVLVRWIPDAEGADPDDDLRIVLVSAPLSSPFPVAGDSMGVVRSDGMRRRIAYVFSDRVRDFAEQGHVGLWLVLGCAIAHELGHLVLPLNAHAPDGIMRAQWDPAMIARAGGFLDFTSEQGRLLRTRISTRGR